MDLIVKQSGNAIGDYARTSGSAANQLKLFNTKIEDLSIMFGEVFVPMLLDAVTRMNDFLSSITTADINIFITALKQMAIGVGVLGAAWATYTLIVNRAIIAETVLKALINPKALIVAAAAVLAASVAYNAYTSSVEAASQAGEKQKEAVSLLTLETQALETLYIKLNNQDLAGWSRDRQADTLAEIKTKEKLVQVLRNQKDLEDQQVENAKVERASVVNEALLSNQILHNEQIKAMQEQHQLSIIEQSMDFHQLTAQQQVAQRISEIEAMAKHNLDKVKSKLKFDIVQAKLEKDKTKRDAKIDKLNKKAELDRNSIKNKAILDANIKSNAFQKALNDKKEQDTAALGTNLMTIGKQSGRDLFEMGKSLSQAQATIAGFTAIQQAASALPFPANIPGIVAETARAAGTLAGISGQNFEHGGVVGGSSFSGDNNQVNVNSGEMILNRGQQSQLFAMANNGGGNGNIEAAIDKLSDRIANMEIVLVADDNEIARSTSRGVEAGVVIGRS